MPTGTFQTTDIPEEEVDNVIANYKLDEPEKIEKIKQSNGRWTVIATFPGGDKL